ncbi:acid protease [Dentipellis sp. KUC8613]|nr:acid protease [Dentipellis sp. KUC8613]
MRLPPSNCTYILWSVSLLLLSTPAVDAARRTHRIKPRARAAGNVTAAHEHLNVPSNLHPRAAATGPPFILPIGIVGNDFSYYTQVFIGRNPRPFNVNVDCGSSEFWVMGEDAQNRGDHNGIGPKLSPGQAPPIAKWATEYEDVESSSLQGFVVRDNVFVSLTAILPNFPFGTAEVMTGSIPTDFEDGIMGFGHSFASRTGAPTIVEALAAARLIPLALSGWKLPRALDGGHGGQISLGAPNTALFNSKVMAEVPNIITEQGDWRVSVRDMTAGGRSLAQGTRVAMLDTGSNDIFMTFTDAHLVNSQIPGAVQLAVPGEFAIPCNTQARIALGIGKFDWPMDPRDLVGDPIGIPGLPNMCWSHILGEDRAEGTFLAGGPFLKNVYFILDIGRNSVTFAQLR